MARKTSNIDSLTRLFDGSSRPIYAIDAERRIVYCNRALAAWLDIESSRIIGRLVEYHSEPAADEDEAREDGPLTDLCPPPQAFAGEACTGTLSCMARGGRLMHRSAEFVPLGSVEVEKKSRGKEQSTPTYAVLGMLAAEDLSAQELASGISGEPMADELHRTIRRFRRAQASRYSIGSLLGGSLAMQKVRAQLAAAAASGASTLIRGPRGSGRGHAARAIHYCAASDVGTKLLPIDCELMSDDLLRRVLERLRDTAGGTSSPDATFWRISSGCRPHTSCCWRRQFEKSCSRLGLSPHVAGTLRVPQPNLAKIRAVDQQLLTIMATAHGVCLLQSTPRLLAAVSTITIDLPPLASRLEDLPVLAQYFLEACNHGSSKQVGSFRSDALDLLALYSWPGELNQLREAIAAAHSAATSHEISAADLPTVVQHAAGTAKRSRRGTPSELCSMSCSLRLRRKRLFARWHKRAETKVKRPRCWE